MVVPQACLPEAGSARHAQGQRAASPVHTGPLRGIVMVAFAEDRAGIEVVIDFQGMVDYVTGQHKH